MGINKILEEINKSDRPNKITCLKDLEKLFKIKDNKPKVKIVQKNPKFSNYTKPKK